MNRFVLSLALLVAAGCKQAPATTPDAGPSPPAVTKLDPACVAAFAPSTDVAPGKTAPVDEDLTLLITRVKASPNNANTLVLLGTAWMKKARHAHDPVYTLHADACARQALVAKARYAPAVQLRALAMLQGHRFAKARDVAREMLAANPNDANALGVLSDALLELGDVDGALAASQRMMELRPSLSSYARASYLQWLRGDEQGALESIRLAYEAGRGQPDREATARVLTEAAHILRHRGDVEGALASYDKALVELPDYAPALVGKARCLLAPEKPSAQQTADAIALLEKAFAAEPLVETAWLLGEAHLAAGRSADAERAFADVKRVGAQSDPRGLALFLATRSKAPADLDEAERALAKDRAARDGIYADDVEALIAWRRNDIDKARRLITSAGRLGTPDARLRMHAAVIQGDGSALDAALKQGGGQDILLRAFVRTTPGR